MAWGWLSVGARVWRRRKEKTISLSARWAAISRTLHLRGAGRALICAPERSGGESVEARGRGGEDGDGSWPLRYLAYGFSSMWRKYHGGRGRGLIPPSIRVWPCSHGS